MSDVFMKLECSSFEVADENRHLVRRVLRDKLPGVTLEVRWELPGDRSMVGLEGEDEALFPQNYLERFRAALDAIGPLVNSAFLVRLEEDSEDGDESFLYCGPNDAAIRALHVERAKTDVADVLKAHSLTLEDFVAAMDLSQQGDQRPARERQR